MNSLPIFLLSYMCLFLFGVFVLNTNLDNVHIAGICLSLVFLFYWLSFGHIETLKNFNGVKCVPYGFYFSSYSLSLRCLICKIETKQPLFKKEKKALFYRIACRLNVIVHLKHNLALGYYYYYYCCYHRTHIKILVSLFAYCQQRDTHRLTNHLVCHTFLRKVWI